jgi:CRP-like cAMP-binding protein
MAAWCVLSPAELGSLDQAKVTKRYEAGAVLFEPGTPSNGLFCVNDGTLLVERVAEGGETRRLRLAEGGDILGWSDFFRGGTHRTRAVCQTAAVVCTIPTHVVRELLHHQPLLALKFLTHAAGELDKAEQQSLEQTSYSARRRLALALAALKNQHGEGSPSGDIVITLPISRRDLADLIAIRPETLSRVIRELEADAVATFSGRTVRIPDLDRLLDEIESAEASAA